MQNKYSKIFEKVTVTCRDVERLLGDYVDDELPLALMMRVDEHFACCENCQHGLDTYKQVISIARDIKAHEPPISDAIRARLRDRLNAELGLNL